MSMSDLLIVAAAPVLALALGVVVMAARRGRSRPPGLPGVPGAPPGYPAGPTAPAGVFGGDPVAGTGMAPQVFPVGPTVELPADLLAHVRNELFEGRKIQAIRLIRQHTGLGLKDAKELADAIESGAPGAAGPGSPGAPASGFAPRSPRPGAGSLSEGVRAFKLAGDRASAVALVRSQTGMTADEAGRFVDALD